MPTLDLVTDYAARSEGTVITTFLDVGILTVEFATQGQAETFLWELRRAARSRGITIQAATDAELLGDVWTATVDLD